MNKRIQPRRRNMRLVEAMAERKARQIDLARVVGCDARTISRWVYESRVPRQEHAEKAAAYLRVDARWLWPMQRSQLNPELLNLYADVSEVSAAVWRRSAQDAWHSIDIATATDTALPHDLTAIIHDRARNGVKVRLCTAKTAAPTASDLVDLRLTTIPGICIYRFDNQMLVHLGQGLDAGRSGPMLYLCRHENGGAFDFYRAVFERLWSSGEGVVNHDSDWFRTPVPSSKR